MHASTGRWPCSGLRGESSSSLVPTLGQRSDDEPLDPLQYRSEQGIRFQGTQEVLSIVVFSVRDVLLPLLSHDPVPFLESSGDGLDFPRTHHRRGVVSEQELEIGSGDSNGFVDEIVHGNRDEVERAVRSSVGKTVSKRFETEHVVGHAEDVSPGHAFLSSSANHHLRGGELQSVDGVESMEMAFEELATKGGRRLVERST